MTSQNVEYGKKIAHKLLETTYTASTFYYRTELLKEFFEEVFFVVARRNRKAKEEMLDFLLRREESQSVRGSFSSITDEEYAVFTSDTLYPIIKAAREEMEKMPTFILYVPVEFNDEELDRLGRWVRRQIASHLVLSPHLNPESVGGCAFLWANTYYDFSLPYFFKNRTGKISAFIKEAYDNSRRKTGIAQ